MGGHTISLGAFGKLGDVAFSWEGTVMGLHPWFEPQVSFPHPPGSLPTLPLVQLIGWEVCSWKPPRPRARWGPGGPVPSLRGGPPRLQPRGSNAAARQPWSHRVLGRGWAAPLQASLNRAPLREMKSLPSERVSKGSRKPPTVKRRRRNWAW